MSYLQNRSKKIVRAVADCAQKVKAVFAKYWLAVTLELMADRLVETGDTMLNAMRRRLERLLRKYIEKGYMLGVEETVGYINAQVIGQLPTPIPTIAIEKLRDKAVMTAALQAGQVTEAAVDTVTLVLEKGMRKGWSIRRMQEEMNRLAEVALGRAETIARTAVVKAANIGAMEQMTKMGIEKLELVGCSPDCDECQQVIAGNPYSPTEAEEQEMGLHPNHTGSWVPAAGELDRWLGER